MFDYSSPKWGATLRNLYWQVRQIRNHQLSFQRKLYRQTAREKKRLIETGVEAETVRLYCRYLANTRNSKAEERFQQSDRQMKLPF